MTEPFGLDCLKRPRNGNVKSQAHVRMRNIFLECMCMIRIYFSQLAFTCALQTHDPADFTAHVLNGNSQLF